MADKLKSEIFQLVNNEIQSGAVDPSAGGGVAAPAGSLYLQFVSDTGVLWVKRLDADTGWVPIGALSLPQTWTKAQDVVAVDLGSGLSGAQAIDCSLSNTFEGEFTGAGSLGTPSNQVNGGAYVFRLLQGVGGSHAITFAAEFDFGTDGAPDTSADAAGTMVTVTGVSDGSKIYCGWKGGFTP